MGSMEFLYNYVPGGGGYARILVDVPTEDLEAALTMDIKKKQRFFIENELKLRRDPYEDSNMTPAQKLRFTKRWNEVLKLFGKSGEEYAAMG